MRSLLAAKRTRSASRRRRVVILYRYVPRYREAFYRLLRDRLAADGIDLDVIYGQPIGEDASKADAAELEWGIRITNRSLALGRKAVCWQPAWGLVRDADLVIVEQASRLLVNYPLLARQRWGGPPVAMWGHGVNLQADTSLASRLGETVKRRYSTWPHWWFAYTEGSARLVRSLGYPDERITVVRNAFDTRRLAEDVRSASPVDVEAFCAARGVPPGRRCLFIGSLYQEKRLPFLLEAAARVAQVVPSFHLIVAGAGPLRSWMEEQAARHGWLSYVGPVQGRDKARLLAASEAILLPGGVGLAVQDSFVAGTPVVTTARGFHGPEIEYIEDGMNGVIVPEAGDASAFAEAVLRLLTCEREREKLRIGCIATSSDLTVERMAERFGAGVRAALEPRLDP